MSRRQLITFLSFSLLFFHFSAVSTFAQGMDLSVAPPVFEVELKPPANAEVKETITLTNNAEEPLELTLKFRQFIPTNKQDGTLEYLPENAPIRGADPEILKKIQVLDGSRPVTTLVMPPKSEKKLTLRIGIPKDEPPSDYYLSLVFLSEREDGKDNQTSTAGGIGINLLLSVGPKGRSSAIIEEFSTKKILQSGPVPFTTRIRNTSKHFLYPKGQILIYNMFGQMVGNVELIPVNILSGSTRAIPSKEQVLYEANKDGTIKEKDNSFLEQVSKDHPVAIWNEKFLMGPYKAHLRLALTDEGPLIEKTIWFFAFPAQALIGVVIAVLVLIFIRQRLKERERRI